MEEYLPEQMSEKTFCSNVALSLGSGPPEIPKYRNTVIIIIVAGQSCDLSKPTGEKYKTNGKRIRSIGATRFKKNPKNHPEMHETTQYAETSISGCFFGFSTNLVTLIDLILFTLVLYFSPVVFDRSHDYPATTLNLTVFLYFCIFGGSRTKGRSDI